MGIMAYSLWVMQDLCHQQYRNFRLSHARVVSFRVQLDMGVSEHLGGPYFGGS